MRAAVLSSSPGRLEVRDVAVDAPSDHEVLVRTVACGLCHTDLHVMTGDMPAPPGQLVLGHEAAGVVEAVGPRVVDIAPGDHVVACLSAFCGECAECGQGRTFLCERRRSLRRNPGERPRLTVDGSPVDAFTGIGGFAEEMLLHRRAVVKVASDIPLQLAALLGCAVLTGVGSVVNGARVRPGETVAVIGIGGIGASIVQGARIAGASRIIAIDLYDSQLDLARRLGATDTVKASGSDVVTTVLEMTSGGVHHAFEAVGLSPTINQAVRMVRPGRDAYMVGVPPVSQPVPIPAGDMVLSGRGLRGLLMGSNHFPIDIPRMVDMYRQGLLHLEELVGRRISLDDVNDAYDEMRGGGHARPVIDFTL